MEQLRWDNYKCCSRKYDDGILVKQQQLYDHFNDQNHNGFVQDVSIIFIDKTDIINAPSGIGFSLYVLKKFD